MEFRRDHQLNAAPAPAAPGEAAFVLIEPLRRTQPLVFASPHSGRRYPEEMLAASRLPLHILRRAEDAYVDELFSSAAGQGAPVLCGAVARTFVDLNREPSELDPDMFDAPLPAPANTVSARVKAGLGAIPRVAGDGQDIYARKLPVAEAERRIETYHRPYHGALSGMIEEAKRLFGCAVLIDCHSMPSCARGAHAPDIVLGDRFGAACHPAITALAEASLRKLGYRVARNAPFAGGHCTQTYGRPARRAHALQIEINRALYLDERTLERTQGFSRLRNDMARLTEAFAAAQWHRSLA